MKRILACLCATLPALTLTAQFLPYVSVAPDRSIKFNIHLNSAQRVQLVGEFLPKKEANLLHQKIMVPDTVDLVKDNQGYWTYTSAPVGNDFYYFNFIVDGQAYTNTPGLPLHGNQNYVVTEPDYKVQDVPHGTIEKVWYPSPTLEHKQRRMTVYLPAAYYANPKQKFPVLYLHHGMIGNEDDWTTVGRAAQIMDNLIAQGKAEPMIVVMPNGNWRQEARSSEASETMASSILALTDLFEGSYETGFKDVLTFVEKTYRVKRGKAHRAIAGLSMGGLHTQTIAANNPDWFDYVGLFSAAVGVQRPGAHKDIYDDMPQKLERQFQKKPRLYWIAIGSDDFLFEANKKMRHELDSIKAPYIYQETNGGHDWHNWRRYLHKFAQMIFK